MTPKMQKFCEAYVKTGSAYRSAIEAGYTEKYAKAKSGFLLQHEAVAARIREIRERLNQRADKSATDVVNEYAKIAFADRVDFLKPDEHFPGCFVYKAPDELTAEQRAIVERVSVTWRTHKRVVEGEQIVVERQEYSYVLSDKANALQQMGRHFGIFDDKLKLEAGGRNPFANASPEQLAAIKAKFIETMAGGEIVDGEFTETAHPKMLHHGSRRSGSGG